MDGRKTGDLLPHAGGSINVTNPPIPHGQGLAPNSRCGRCGCRGGVAWEGGMRDIAIVDPSCFNCKQPCRLMACSDLDDWIAICLNQDCELGRRGIEQNPAGKPITNIKGVFTISLPDSEDQ
jgi:hypothetical protein